MATVITVKEIQASEFKTHCLKLLDEVAQRQEPLIITKHGRPVAKLVPYDREKDAGEAGLRGLATFVGDIVSPVDDDGEPSRD